MLIVAFVAQHMTPTSYQGIEMSNTVSPEASGDPPDVYENSSLEAFGGRGFHKSPLNPAQPEALVGGFWGGPGPLG